MLKTRNTIPKHLGIDAALKVSREVPVMAQWLINPTSIHEALGSISGLDQWVKDLELP